MENLGDIDAQSIAGAISTGTHGTGAAVRRDRDPGRRARRWSTASGDLLTVERDENAELLPAVALGLGALGVLVDVTLQCVPAFLLQAVERPEPLGDGPRVTLDERPPPPTTSSSTGSRTPIVALTKRNTRLPGDAPRHRSPARRAVDRRRVVGNGALRLRVRPRHGRAGRRSR